MGQAPRHHRDAIGVAQHQIAQGDAHTPIVIGCPQSVTRQRGTESADCDSARTWQSPFARSWPHARGAVDHRTPHPAVAQAWADSPPKWAATLSLAASMSTESLGTASSIFKNCRSV